MNGRRVAAIVVSAALLGLMVGTVTSGYAATGAPATTPVVTSESATPGLGIRLGAMLRDAGARLADVVADLTGTSVDEVMEGRQAGESYADIAAESGVTTEAVIGEALEQRERVLDEQVAAGTITQEQADAALERMQERLEAQVENEAAGCYGGGRQGAGPGADGSYGQGARRGAGNGLGGGQGTGCPYAR